MKIHMNGWMEVREEVVDATIRMTLAGGVNFRDAETRTHTSSAWASESQWRFFLHVPIATGRELGESRRKGATEQVNRMRYESYSVP